MENPKVASLGRLSSEQTAVWVLSHHTCNTLSIADDSLFDENTYEYYDETVNVKIHKEEGDNRQNLDSAGTEPVPGHYFRVPG